MLQIFAFCLIAPWGGRGAPLLAQRLPRPAPSPHLIERAPRGDTQLCPATTHNLSIMGLHIYLNLDDLNAARVDPIRCIGMQHAAQW